MGNEVIKEIDLKGIIAPSVEAAFELITKSIKGEEVDLERLKTAKFLINSYKSARIMAKEDRKVGITEKKFNFGVLDKYGSDEQKKEIKELIQKSLTKIKYIE
jgi:hypothetical protein